MKPYRILKKSVLIPGILLGGHLLITYCSDEKSGEETRPIEENVRGSSIVSGNIAQDRQNHAAPAERLHSEIHLPSGEILKLSDWRCQGGIFELSDSVFIFRSYGDTRAFYSGKSYQDFIYEVQLMKLATSSPFGLLIRYTPENNNGYMYFVYPYGGPQFKRLDHGRESDLGVISGSNFKGKLNQWDTLKIICRGSHFSLFINGQFQAEIVDDAFQEGFIGLIAGGLPFNKSKFKIINVQPL